MKSFWFKAILWEIWSIAANYVFFGEEMALLGIAFFLVTDLICLFAYLVRRKRGEDVLASIKNNFDILPYKWFWIGGVVATVSLIHWEEHTLLCCFMWLTVLVAYVVDTIDNYGIWKKQQKE